MEQYGGRSLNQVSSLALNSDRKLNIQSPRDCSLGRTGNIELTKAWKSRKCAKNAEKRSAHVKSANKKTMNNVRQAGRYTNISADTLIKTGAGVLYGFIVNSHTSGTLKLWDNTSAATTVICNTITFAAGPNFVVFPTGMQFATGLYADIGGTIDLTLIWE